MTRRDYQDPTYKRNRASILAGSPDCHWCGKAKATQADHLIKLNNRGYLDSGTIHPGMLEGSVKGYKHLEDACEDADALRDALTKIS